LDESLPNSSPIEHELESAEIQLIDTIARFPGEVQRAAEEYKTLHITNLAFELARDFNDFYKQCPVLKAEPGVRDYRLRLVAAARQTISNALYLLSIHAPDVM
jgi:arginyl-tRNA synthetase